MSVSCSEHRRAGTLSLSQAKIYFKKACFSKGTQCFNHLHPHSVNHCWASPLIGESLGVYVCMLWLVCAGVGVRVCMCSMKHWEVASVSFCREVSRISDSLSSVEDRAYEGRKLKHACLHLIFFVSVSTSVCVCVYCSWKGICCRVNWVQPQGERMWESEVKGQREKSKRIPPEFDEITLVFLPLF